MFCCWGRTKPTTKNSHELCPCFYVWMKLEGRQVQFFWRNPPTGPLRRSSDHTSQRIFAFKTCLPCIFDVQICLGRNCNIRDFIYFVLKVIQKWQECEAARRHAINVAEMRETLSAPDTQIWNHKCIIARCRNLRPGPKPERASSTSTHALDLFQLQL